MTIESARRPNRPAGGLSVTLRRYAKDHQLALFTALRLGAGDQPDADAPRSPTLFRSIPFNPGKRNRRRPNTVSSPPASRPAAFASVVAVCAIGTNPPTSPGLRQSFPFLPVNSSQKVIHPPDLETPR